MDPHELYSYSQLTGFFNYQSPYQFLDPLCSFPSDNIHEHLSINQPPFYGISEVNAIHNETFSFPKEEDDNKGKSDQFVLSPKVASSGSGWGSEKQQSDLLDENDSQESAQTEIGNKKRKTNTGKRPHYAFKTRSETDLLADGYKWRKYGKKYIKSSPYPRSYYRCSDRNCDVKKKVERDPSDKTMIITTYDGHHNHESPWTIYYMSPILPLSL